MSRKTVVITGCSEGGIGAALALEFHAQGYRVFATARNVGKMRSLAEQGIETLPLDVDSDESIAACAAAVQEAADKLDYLVNNAGVHHVLPFTDSRIEDLRRVVNTNVVGVLAVTQAFVPLLIRARGTVATVGSINEVLCPPYSVAYSASKAAVHAVSRVLRVELAPLGVRFVTLVTGSVKSKLGDNTPSKVPEDSLYRAAASTIENHEFLRGQPVTDTDVFARQVVRDLTRPQPKLNIWRGGSSTWAWFLSWFGWEGIFVSYFYSFFSLPTPPFFFRRGDDFYYFVELIPSVFRILP
ncbi:putative short-chain dehydrogenase/reductase [Daldinia bambusicola]|nr:putative short-chain dehydrogenase/reductase [Daldinia bambusicola]